MSFKIYQNKEPLNIQPKLSNYDKENEKNVNQIPQFSSVQPELFKMNRKPPAFKIGTEKRKMFNESSNKNPGVGQYDPVKISKRSPTYHITGKSSIRDKYSTLCGPQSYIPNYECQFKKSPCYSLRHRYMSIQISSTPGPGDYENMRSSLKTNSVVFEKARRSSITSVQSQLELPGPGQYITNEQQSKRQNPSFSFSKQKRLTVDNLKYLNNSMDSKLVLQSPQENAPGPQTYNYLDMDVIKKKKPRVIFGTQKRNLCDISLETPGVGSYNIQRPETSFSASVVGKSRVFPTKFMVPGPQDYEPRYDQIFHKAKSMIISQSPRQILQKYQTIVPGPGQYNIQNRKEFKFATQKAKRSISIQSNTPVAGSLR